MGAAGIDPFVFKIMAVISVLVVTSLMLFIWKFTAPKEGNNKEKSENEEIESEKQKETEKKRGAIRRIRNRATEREAEVAPEQNEPNGEPENQEIEKKVVRPVGKAGLLSKKKLKKIQEKEEKAKYREALEAKKKETTEEEDKQIYERLKKRQIEEENQEKEEAELLLARQEREKKDLEVYNSLKHQFSVEESGNLTDSIQIFENKIEDFIEEVKKKKVIFVEEMAAKYEVKPQVIVDKINQLDSSGRLSGIIDERGKYIYLTEQELSSVAMFVKQRGRVSVLDLQKESNKLINLSPQTTELSTGENGEEGNGNQ